MPPPTMDYAKSVATSQRWVICGIAACVIAIAAIAAPVPSILDVASYPPGTSMRPMNAVAMIFLGGAGGGVALAFAIVCLVAGRRRRAGWVLGGVAFGLGLVAVFADGWVFNALVASRGYVMEP